MKSPAKKAVAKKAPAKRTAKKVPTVSLAEVARGVKVNEKVARAKFRRLGDKSPVTRVGTKGWMFAASDRAKVEAVLTGK